MGSIESVERYLRAHVALTAPEQRAPPNTVHAFVTISRQAGAGGHSLADRLIERFDAHSDTELFGGWGVYDQRLCEIVAADPRMKEAFDSLVAEEYRSAADDFFRQVIAPTVDQDAVMARVFEVIHAVASTGNAVILGRGGSHVTDGLAHGVHIRLVAPEHVRLERLMALNGIGERAARDLARDLDANRARLVKARFKADIDDPLCYDAIWNTGSATIDEIADAVIVTVRHRATAPRPA